MNTTFDPTDSPSSLTFRFIFQFDLLLRPTCMGRASRLTSFCLGWAVTRVLVRSPQQAETRRIDSKDAETEKLKRKSKGSDDVGDGGDAKVDGGRRVVIVVDSCKEESRGAVQWALTHTVQIHDTVVLLRVVKPKNGGREGKRDRQLLKSLKTMCQAEKPEVQVEFSLVEGRERGPVIVQETRRQEASLLVLGQKRRSITWHLLLTWAGGSRGGGGVVDYCIQNASCMTVAVRRKRKGGGYIITTKRHKDFWLLA